MVNKADWDPDRCEVDPDCPTVATHVVTIEGKGNAMALHACLRCATLVRERKVEFHPGEVIETITVAPR